MNYDDTNLDYYLRDQKRSKCLDCSLPICDEESPSCLYQITRSRKGYFAYHYQQNREKKIEAAKERNKANGHIHQREWQKRNKDKKNAQLREWRQANREHFNAQQREYRKRKKEERLQA